MSMTKMAPECSQCTIINIYTINSPSHGSEEENQLHNNNDITTKLVINKPSTDVCVYIYIFKI